MTTVRLRILVDGFNEYRNSETVTAALEGLAAGIVTEAQANVEGDALASKIDHEGADVVQRTVHSKDRARVYVSTPTLRGRIAEHNSRALNRAVQGHGGTA